MRRAAAAAARRIAPSARDRLAASRSTTRPPPPVEPPVDAVQDYPDIVSAEGSPCPPVLVAEPRNGVTEDTQESLFDAAGPPPAYRLPDRAS